MTTMERSGGTVTMLRRLAKAYAVEGRGVLEVKSNEEKAFVTCGDLIVAEFPSRMEAQAHLRAGGFGQVESDLWRPRYLGAPWLA